MNASFVIIGKKSQNSAEFGNFKNTQCTANSISSLCFAHIFDLKQWNAHTIDNILEFGNYLHKISYSNRSDKTCDFLTVDEIKLISLKTLNSNIQWKPLDYLDPNRQELQGYLYFDLKSCLNFFFNLYKFGVFTTKGVSIGLFKNSYGYCIFDPHSCNPITGLFQTEGFAVTMVYSNFYNFLSMMNKKFVNDQDVKKSFTNIFQINPIEINHFELTNNSNYNTELLNPTNNTKLKKINTNIMKSSFLSNNYDNVNFINTKPEIIFSNEFGNITMISDSMVIEEHNENLIKNNILKNNDSDIVFSDELGSVAMISDSMVIEKHNENLIKNNILKNNDSDIVFSDELGSVAMISDSMVIEKHNENFIKNNNNNIVFSDEIGIVPMTSDSMVIEEHSKNFVIGDDIIFSDELENVSTVSNKIYIKPKIESPTNSLYMDLGNCMENSAKNTDANVFVKKYKSIKTKTKFTKKKKKLHIKNCVDKLRNQEVYREKEKTNNQNYKTKKPTKNKNQPKIQKDILKGASNVLSEINKTNDNHSSKITKNNQNFNSTNRSITESKSNKQVRSNITNTEVIQTEKTTDPFTGNSNPQIEIKKKKIIENSRSRISKSIQRQNDILKFRHNFYNQLYSQNKSQSAKNMLTFIASKLDAPEKICSCCEGLFFKHSVTILNIENIKTKLNFNNLEFSQFLAKILNYPSDYLCNTCKKSIMRKKVPKLATSNGLKFKEIPECLKVLSPLEERLCAPYIPFMQIKPLKLYSINAQLGLRGSVVNIPIDVNECLHILPRTFDEMATIQVQLKRHIQHKSFYMFETLKPAKIIDALNYLRTTPLYIKNKINIDEKYFEQYKHVDENINFVVQQQDMVHTQEITNTILNKEGSNEVDSDEEIGENVLILNRENFRQNNIQIVAPGQGKSPLSAQFIENFDELCFPKIFCGHGLNLPKFITYTDRIKSECRRYDRRSCTPERLLFMAKQKIERQLTASINICLRKTRKSTDKITVTNLSDPNFVNNLIKVDSGYTFTKQIRNSPAFLEQKKKNLLATIRQLNRPTFFLTLSCAEIRWPELIISLVKLQTGQTITLKEALEMNLKERTLLVQQDPVTCARYFHNKISHFIKLIKSPYSIFENYLVEDIYQRVEFQMRGSPHEHMFLWLKDSPKFYPENISSTKQVIEFIDKFITCEFNDSDPYIALQKHAHTHTCYKTKLQKIQNKCRFHFPLPIMPETMILFPLPKKDISDEIKSNLKKIQNLMKHFSHKLEHISFECCLDKLNMSREDYIIALRSSLQQIRVFLKRKSSEVNINAYNLNILHLFESNMDLQFVLEEYGLASYIVNYISKSEAGLSKLLRDTSNEIELGNFSLKEKFRKIGNVFLNGSLMSAQEAVYYLLSLPVSKSSRLTVFINTSRSTERVLMLKNKSLLNKLPGDSEDIYMEDIIKKYCKRKKCYENICLAEFAAYHHTIFKDTDDMNDDDDVTDSKSQTTRIRTKAAIIRYVKYKHAKDPSEYYREHVLLCLPFRNELEEIENQNCKELYYKNKIIINQNEEKFGITSDIDDILVEVMEEIQNNEENDTSEEMDNENLDPYFQIDVLDQGGIGGGNKSIETNRFTIPSRISDDNLHNLLTTLNTRQGKFVNYILQRYIKNETPFKIYLSGSAGVGKSTVINTIYQLITKYFDSLPGGNKDKIVVLLCAPSGKAAYLINGTTLHTAFALPVVQFAGNMPELSANVANTMRENFFHLKLLIIDEISMVGGTLLTRIETRLRQIFGSNDDFGGLSLLVVGDLSQLPPVMDSPLYKPVKNEFEILLDRNPLWDKFEFYELTEIMRQKEDIEFIEVLNNIAQSKITEKDIKIINSRIVSNPADIPKDAVRLFSKNKDVDEYNERAINQHKETEYISIAKDSIVGKTTEFKRLNILQSVKNKKITEVNGLPHRAVLKIGIKYMITSNIDIKDGLCNGATGILKHIEFKPGTNEPFKIFLEFDRPDVGSKKRKEQQQYMIMKNINTNITPIDKISCILNMSNKLEFQVVREQFPIVCAEAITIHKSQGQTYNKIVIDFTKCTNLARSMLYVALSRVTKLTGLFIIGKFVGLNKPKKDDPILLEMERLRQEKQIKL